MSLENSPFFLLNLSGDKMNGEENRSYSFKSFRLDVEERRLFHNGVSISLEPKVFDLLTVLVGHSGHLVEKDELLKLVWSDSFVEEANIARTIYTLRKVLGEKSDEQQFIETVAKKGYRFVAKVTEISEENEPKAEKKKQKAVNFFEKPTVEEVNIPQVKTDETVNQPTAAPKHKTRIILFTVGFLSALFLLLLLSFNFQSGTYANPNKVKSIAVLPLKPINTATRDEIYEIGIADSLIYRLSSSKGFIVRPLSATRKYRDIAQDPIVAGKEQQVDYVLASNYQLAGGKIKITLQLFNVASGQLEESYKSEKDAGDVFAMQDAVAGEVLN